ncbi:phage integrase SAM-like domain-containing protein [Spirosoma jeollabukense]
MYKYHRPDSTIDVQFECRKARARKKAPLGTPDAKVDHDSVIDARLTIGDNKYGPYATGIKTFYETWKGRQSDPIPFDSRELIKALGNYQGRIESAHETLLRMDQPIDGQAVMNVVRSDDPSGKLITLARVYDEFMTARRDMVERDQKKRTIDQISLATYETYPKRWSLIQGYLVYIKRSQMPVRAIMYSFATDLKEWLNKQRKPSGERYNPATINKVISLLKMLMGYSLSKGYVGFNPVRDFACRGGSVANPKPLTKEQLDDLETCPLPHHLRHVCDSWLVAGELCLHYADYMKLPTIKFITRKGIEFIQHPRSKQQGTNLKQTVNVTERAKRLIEKWGGVKGLYYRHSSVFSKALKEIAEEADLRDEEGNLIGLQFGHGRDSGLTQRVIDGANSLQLSEMGGWSNASYARRYVNNPVAIVAGFVNNIPKRGES